MTAVEATTPMDAASRPRTGAPAPVHRHRRPVTDRLLAVWSILIFLFLFAPIIVIVLYSFNNGRLLTAFTEFGFDGYAAAVPCAGTCIESSAGARRAGDCTLRLSR